MSQTLLISGPHRPYVRELRDGVIRVRLQTVSDQSAPDEREMPLPVRRIINVGSVGEARHGNTHATYVVHDEATGSVEIREVPHDVERTCRAIVEADVAASCLGGS
jgi:diadenosine tetraphosphatase ApaH/serine/threonine PP2A family protein phosphatase